ncbi:protein phosphatase 1 regulatory subunit 3B-like isoform X2 [Corythoichthys intestinalis]|nr:protein phosphatase 1 regulatory subunit 3B-like isoform X2 [Corythoichthys intestinalis]XP_061800506.1 protein phosphatase 1 regulatory subunit 3B-like [Nerophis lumbriciformis]
MPTDMAPSLFLSQEDFAHLGCGRSPAPQKTKKQVTFADHLGLPLARVKVFSRFKDVIRIPAGVDRPAPVFPPPASDDGTCVRLETCVLMEQTLAGTVKVKNLSYEKRVALRVTFDAWESHSDVDCEYAGSDGNSFDTFAFRLVLPAGRRPEFAVRYRVAGTEYWDSNRGRNYRPVPAVDEGYPRRDRDPGELTPEWPAYAGYENVGPYY